MRLALTSALAGLAVLLTAATAPKLPITSFDQLPKPLPLPYDDGKGNADLAVANGLRLARAQGKLLLIDLGGNWCLDCRLLAGTIDVAPLKSFVEKHYVVVTVDVGRFDRNGQVPARYGITGRLAGVPSLLVVDPKTNRLINAGRTAALADARSMGPQALADWLAQWVR